MNRHYFSGTDMFHFVSQSPEFEVDMQTDEIRSREVGGNND